MSSGVKEGKDGYDRVEKGTEAGFMTSKPLRGPSEGCWNEMTQNEIRLECAEGKIGRIDMETEIGLHQDTQSTLLFVVGKGEGRR